MTHTFVCTFTRRTPANPYLVCTKCGAHVCFWPQWPPESDMPRTNEPCGHPVDYRNLCPSWGPVNGCRCREHLGEVPHGPASDCPEHGPK